MFVAVHVTGVQLCVVRRGSLVPPVYHCASLSFPPALPQGGVRGSVAVPLTAHRGRAAAQSGPDQRALKCVSRP